MDKFLRDWFAKHDKKLQEQIVKLRKLAHLPVLKVDNKPPGDFSFRGRPVFRVDAPADFKSTFYPHSKFTKFLVRKGFVEVGSGFYSTVLAHPKSDKVIKILRKPDEDGWLDYVRWSAEKGYAGTWAPKVYSYKYNKAGFGVAVMERMAKSFWEIPVEEPVQCLTQLVSLQGNPMAERLLNTEAPGLYKFFGDLKTSFPRLDMHGGNSMIRKDGSLCYTDPVARRITNGSVKIRLRQKDLTPKVALAA